MPETIVRHLIPKTHYIAYESVMTSHEKIYIGDRTIDGLVVTVNGQPLDQRLDIETFSVNGFEWSYAGDESRQLALALLADHLADEQQALALSEAFMQDVVSELENTWELSSADIEAALQEIRARQT